MYGLKREQIEGLRKAPFIADVLDENGTIKPADQSKILSGHFGVVPGVVTEHIAAILAGINPSASLETNYLSTLKPGNNIRFRGGREEPTIYIAGKEEPISILTTANVSGRDLVHYDFPEEYQVTDFDNSIIGHHLLQSGNFQLASGATTLNNEGYFSGHYSVPENHPLLIEGKLSAAITKEIGYQIVSLANSLTNNPEGIQTGATILLANSHIARDNPDHPITTPGGSRIIVTGKAGIDPTDPKKRRLIAEYTAYNENIPLYHGKIIGTKVLTKMLFR